MATTPNIIQISSIMSGSVLEGIIGLEANTGISVMWRPIQMG